jgi:hypothetical protein
VHPADALEGGGGGEGGAVGGGQTYPLFYLRYVGLIVSTPFLVQNLNPRPTLNPKP